MVTLIPTFNKQQTKRRSTPDNPVHPQPPAALAPLRLPRGSDPLINMEIFHRRSSWPTNARPGVSMRHMERNIARQPLI